jgi:phage gp36-like protein
MSYAAVSDMILRFGAAEMIRLTTPQDQDMVQVNPAPALLALGDADDLINSYVSKRYAVPLTPVPGGNIPPAINRASCVLARYDLATGDGKEPSESVRLARKEVIAWLEAVAAGRVLLALTEAPGDDSFAIMSDRGAVYGPGFDRNIFPAQAPGSAQPYTNSDPGGPNLADYDFLEVATEQGLTP